jgi:hypothetical protein
MSRDAPSVIVIQSPSGVSRTAATGRQSWSWQHSCGYHVTTLPSRRCRLLTALRLVGCRLLVPTLPHALPRRAHLSQGCHLTERQWAAHSRLRPTRARRRQPLCAYFGCRRLLRPPMLVWLLCPHRLHSIWMSRLALCLPLLTRRRQLMLPTKISVGLHPRTFPCRRSSSRTPRRSASSASLRVRGERHQQRVQPG